MTQNIFHRHHNHQHYHVLCVVINNNDGHDANDATHAFYLSRQTQKIAQNTRYRTKTMQK